MKSTLHIVSFVSITLLLPIAYAFPGWDNINIIYYNTSQDDVYNKFLLQAANELKTNLENVSLKTFTIDNTTKPSVGIFLINDSSHAKLSGRNEESFWLYTNDSGIYIIGKTPMAVRHGAYTLLEKLGFRWLFPNPVWHVKPNSLPSIDLNEVQEPAFEYRTVWYWSPLSRDNNQYKSWLAYNKMPGPREFRTDENYRPYIVTNAECSANPSWCCGNQIDVTNPQVLQEGIQLARNGLNNPNWLSVSIEPTDEANWNGCPFSSTNQNITDAVFSFTNEVAKALKGEFPDKYIATKSYSTHSLLPNIPSFESNVAVLVTTNYASLPTNIRLNYFVSKGAKVGIYDYTLLNGKAMQQYIDNIRYLNQLGGMVYYDEGIGRWGELGLTHYVISKLVWDPNQNVDTIKQDFYDKAFGPASETMKRFYERHDGQSYTKRRVLALAFNDLKEAENLAAGRPDIIERIRHLEYYLRWEWQRNFREPYNTTTTEGSQAWRDFQCGLITTNVIMNCYYGDCAGDFQQSTWNNCTKNPPPPAPSETQARIWMDEATTAFANEQLVDVWPVFLEGKELVPLNAGGYPVVAPTQFLVKGKYLVKIDQARIQKSDVLSLTVNAPVGISGTTPRIEWYDPDNIQLANIVPTASPQQINLPLTKPGIYTMKFFTFWCCSGTFTFSGFDVPASLDLSADTLSRFADVNGYFYVPTGTPALAVYMRVDWSTKRGNITFRDPNGAVVLDVPVPYSDGSRAEWIVKDPTPGLWRLDITHQGRTSLELYGVLPLLWYDPQNLLVPASALLKALLGQYRQAMKPIVDGSNITIEIPITFYDKSSTAFTVSKPLWNNTINFRFNESGTVTSINTTHITFTVDPNKSVSLLFDIPPPRKTKDIASITNNTFYRKEITISSDNSLVNVTATIDINTNYANYKLYELQGSTWIDVTSNYDLTISNNKATFSGFSTSEKQFRIEGSTEACTDSDNDNYYKIDAVCSLGNDCNDANPDVNPSAAEICGNAIDEDCSGADLSCPEQSPGGTSSGGSSGGGGAIVSISAPIEKPITKEPETTSPQSVTESAGTVSMELSAPDTVESGDIYDATVKLLSPIKKTYTLKIADVQQQIALDAGKEKTITVPIYAPDTKGAFTLTASIDGTTRSKDISLNFLPLILTVDKSKSGNQTLVNITVKNYQPLSTELRIIKDNRQDVFIELIEGQKEYQRQLKLTQPGEYKIIAVASSEGKMIDTDQYLLSVEGKKSSNYGMILIVVFSFAVIVIMITFLVRPPKIS